MTITQNAHNEATRDRLGGSRAAAILDAGFAHVGGICPVCGCEMTRDRGRATSAEACHVIPATAYGAPTSARAGWLPGNIFAGCRACNEWMGDRIVEDVRIVEAAAFAWPTGRKAPAVTESDERARRAEMRQKRGF